MGMQSFRGAGGIGAYVSHAGNDDAQILSEYECTALKLDALTNSERRVERVLVAIATVLWTGIGALVVVWLV